MRQRDELVGYLLTADFGNWPAGLCDANDQNQQSSHYGR
jgi:hypothetical protein